MVLVTGPNIKLGGELLTELSKPKSRLEVLHSPVQADQMADKLLLVKVGEYFSKYQERDLIIVSKDKGSRRLQKYSVSIGVRQSQSLGTPLINEWEKRKATPQKKKPKKQSKKDPPSQAPKPERIPPPSQRTPRRTGLLSNCENQGIDRKLRMHSSHRFRTFANWDSNSSADAIVNWLKQTGKLSIKNGKITWADA